MATLVIGAGAAGLSSASALHKAGEAVTVLEARDRIGGRVYTDRTLSDVPVELGAEFIHGDFAPTWLLARDLGLKLSHWQKMDDSLVRLADGSLRTMREARQHAPDFDITRSWDVPFVPVYEPDEDLESYLRRIGFSGAQLGYVQRGFAGAASEAMRNISARAAIDEITDETAGTGDYRILNGYDTLMESLARGLDIRLNTPVESIAWSGESVRVTASDGKMFEADRVIITLPLGVLKAGRVRFVPDLPPEKQAAIDRLIVGPVLKLVYRFAQSILPDGVMALYSNQNPCMWWSPTFAQSSREYVITAFVTADRARELLAMGEAAALEQGVRVLREELSQPDLQPLSSCMVNWVADPFSLGGYTVTPPGAVDAHAALAMPTASRLFWAGEAAAGHIWKASVHGAYASGLRAAAEVLTVQNSMRTH